MSPKSNTLNHTICILNTHLQTSEAPQNMILQVFISKNNPNGHGQIWVS